MNDVWRYSLDIVPPSVTEPATTATLAPGTYAVKVSAGDLNKNTGRGNS